MPTSLALPTPSVRVRAGIWALLLAVGLLSFGLRFGAIARLLPVHPEPDASLVWTYRALAGQATPEALKHMGIYPVLLPRVLALCSSVVPLRPAPVEASLNEHLEAASAAYLNMRVLIAAISFLLAPIGFFVARRWMSDGWALLCAMLLATALMHIAHSGVAKPHAAHATFAWLAIVLALRQLEAPSVPRILASIGAAVLAIGTLPTGLFVLPPLLVAALLAPRSSRAVAWLAWIAPALALLGGLAFEPAGLHLGSGGVVMGRGHTIFFGSLKGRGLLLWPHYLWEHDPVLAIFALLGLFVLLRGIPGTWRDPLARCRMLLVAAYALPYLAVISLDSKVADRYLLPVYPLFALLAVLAARASIGALRGRTARVLACATLLALPTWIAVRFTWLGSRPNTFEQLASWIEEQPDARTRKIMLSPSITPPLLPTSDALAHQLAHSAGRAQPWFYYLGQLAHLPTSAPAYQLEPISPPLYLRPADPDALASYFDRERPEWIVLEVTSRSSWFPGADAVVDAVAGNAEFVTVFSGEHARYAGDRQIDYQDVRDLAFRVLTATSFGPHLEVYHWPSQ